MKDIIALFIAIAAAAAIVYFMQSCSSCGDKPKPIPIIPSAPDTPTVTVWTQRGHWSIPFQVRYAQVDIVTNKASEWSSFFTSSEYSNPIVVIGPHANARRILRQFEGNTVQVLDVVSGATAIWTDTHSDNATSI